MQTNKLMFGTIIVMFVGVIGCNAAISLGTADSLEVTVTKTERITTGSGETLGSKYLVFTETETFENTDSVWYGKWDSSDLHGRLKPGGRYSVKVYGWRLPFFSSYRNIVSATEVVQ